MRAVVWTERFPDNNFVDHYNICEDEEEANDLFDALKHKKSTYCAAIADITKALDPHWTD